MNDTAVMDTKLNTENTINNICEYILIYILHIFTTSIFVRWYCQGIVTMFQKETDFAYLNSKYLTRKLR